MAMRRAVLLAVWLAAVVSIAPARAQSGDILRPSDGSSVDEHIARELQEHRGVVILDAILSTPAIGGDTTRCAFPVLTLGQASNKDAPQKTVRGSVVGGGGKLVAFGAITSLPPGEHLVLSIACNNTSESYSGPHAKFQVRAGEIVNVGALRIDHKSDALFSQTGKMHRAVEDLNPDIVAFLKARAPRAMTNVVRRPMTMLGAADNAARTRTQVCGPLGCL